MLIKEVFLHNIQAYSQARVSLSPKINVLIGKNNSGKSTLLRSLLNFQTKGVSNPNTLLRKFQRESVVLITVENPPHTGTLRSKQTDEQHAFIFEGRTLSFFYSQLSDTLPNDVNLPSLVVNLKNNGQAVETKLFQDAEPKNVFNVFLGKRKSIFNNGSFDQDAAKRIELDFRNLSSKLNRARSNINSRSFDEACEDILGFVPVVLPGQQNMNLASVGYYLATDENIGLDQMGDGVLQTVGLLIDLFFAKKKIFLIEELENDLHPYAIKKLLDLIISASSDNQFIISTHSNIVVRTLGSIASTTIFETQSTLVHNQKDNRRIFTSTLRPVENTPKERIRVLQDLGYELIDSHMWDCYLILEESSAEELIRGFIIPAFVPGLKDKLRTIAANGVGDVERRFTNLLHFFTYVHTSPVYENRAWILVDGDQAGDQAIKAMRKGYKSWPEKHFQALAKANIEKYYPTGYAEQIKEIEAKPAGDEKGKMKVDLAKQVVSEFHENPNSVKKAFKQSVAEIVDFLKQIEKDINDTRK